MDAVAAGDDGDLLGAHLLAAADEVAVRADPRADLRRRRGVGMNDDRALRHRRAGAAEDLRRLGVMLRRRRVRDDVPERRARDGVFAVLFIAPEIGQRFFDLGDVDGTLGFHVWELGHTFECRIQNSEFRIAPLLILHSEFCILRSLTAAATSAHPSRSTYPPPPVPTSPPGTARAAADPRPTHSAADRATPTPSRPRRGARRGSSRRASSPAAAARTPRAARRRTTSRSGTPSPPAPCAPSAPAPSNRTSARSPRRAGCGWPARSTASAGSTSC